MKTREKIQKEYNKYLITFLINIFVCIGLFIAGGFVLDNGIIILGIVLFSVAALSIILPLILLLIASKKYRPLIIEAFICEIKEALETKGNSNTFIDIENKEISFEDDNLIVEQENINYSDLQAVILLKNKPKMMTDDVEMVVGIFNEDKEIIIPFNGDLFKLIKGKNIEIINNEDFEYFLNNMEVCSKKLLKMAAFQYQLNYIPFVFDKTKEEKKVKRKVKTKLVLVNIAIILAILGLTALFTWLGATESGLKISDSIAFNLGFKIIYSTVILGLAVVKSKEIKFYGKGAFILYLVFYWYGILFLNAKVNLLMQIVFFIIFVVLGIILLDKKDLNNKPLNRLIGFGMFIFIIFMSGTTNYNVIEENKIFGIFAIIAGCLLVPSFIVSYFILNKKYKQNQMKKSSYISSLIYVPLCISIAFLAIFSFVFINLNYALDSSIPIKTEEEIIALEKGDKYESDCVIVLIDGKKVEIPIPSRDYFNFEVGDKIDVSLYSGFFGYKYYIYEGKD